MQLIRKRKERKRREEEGEGRKKGGKRAKFEREVEGRGR
jgi:hypothetical protein